MTTKNPSQGLFRVDRRKGTSLPLCKFDLEHVLKKDEEFSAITDRS